MTSPFFNIDPGATPDEESRRIQALHESLLIVAKGLHDAHLELEKTKRTLGFMIFLLLANIACSAIWFIYR